MTTLSPSSEHRSFYSVATLLTTLLSVCIFGVTAVNLVISSWQQSESGKALMLEQAKAVGLLVASGSSNGVIFGQRELLERAARGVESLSSFDWIIIRNANGETLYEKNIERAPEYFRQGASLLPLGSVRTMEEAGGDILVAAPVENPADNDRRGEILLGLNMREMQKAVERNRQVMILGSLATALAFGFLAFIVARLFSKENAHHVRIAQRVTQGDLTMRVSEKFTRFTPNETVILRRAFNKMLDSLEKSYEEMNIKNKRLQEATDQLLLLNKAVAERAEEIERRNQALAALNEELNQRSRELEEKNRQIEEQNEALQMMNIEKNEFLGIAAHDLKNPLSGIQGLASMLEDNADNPTSVREIAQVIMSGAEKMLELIGNLLDVNQLEQGGRKYEIQPVNVAWALMPVIESYFGRAEQKNITIDYSFAEETLICLADPLGFSQVFDNIISNAVKYSPMEKKIWISASRNGNMARISVRDEGPGLSEEDKKKLFGKFARLSAQPTGGEHSTGLGLSIVKSIAEGMGGKVWCESELGKGATFIVELPLAAQAELG
jgi:signal transduction histidine kinase